MIEFRIWFADRSVGSGVSFEDWAALPAAGVEFVHVTEGFDEFGRRLGRWLTGSDHYWHDGETIDQSGESAPVRGEWAVSGAPPGASVKTGLWIEDTALAAIFAEAAEWVDG